MSKPTAFDLFQLVWHYLKRFGIFLQVVWHFCSLGRGNPGRDGYRKKLVVPPVKGVDVYKPMECLYIQRRGWFRKQLFVPPA